MSLDLWLAYRHMLRSRLFEEAVTVLWEQGLISGEMHLGTGEEAIVAGVVLQLQDGDALALDHRGTAPMVMRGVDLVLLLREFLGRTDGLCGGMGGHMHLFAPEYLAESSGIVGASGPAAAGFALAAQHLRPGKLAVAFFGEGAANQGMLMEALNLASVWRLPALFVCKDNQWEVTTQAASVTGGNLSERARSFGMTAVDVDGSDIEAVWAAAETAMQRLRQGEGPAFLHASCVHLQGHFLGDQFLRTAGNPLGELKTTTVPMLRSFLRPAGAPFKERMRGLSQMMAVLSQAPTPRLVQDRDPLVATRAKLASDQVKLQQIEAEVSLEIQQAVEAALSPVPAEEGSVE